MQISGTASRRFVLLFRSHCSLACTALFCLLCVRALCFLCGRFQCPAMSISQVPATIVVICTRDVSVELHVHRHVIQFCMSDLL